MTSSASGARPERIAGFAGLPFAEERQQLTLSGGRCERSGDPVATEIQDLQAIAAKRLGKLVFSVYLRGHSHRIVAAHRDRHASRQEVSQWMDIETSHSPQKDVGGQAALDSYDRLSDSLQEVGMATRMDRMSHPAETR